MAKVTHKKEWKSPKLTSHEIYKRKNKKDSKLTAWQYVTRLPTTWERGRYYC